MAAVHMATMTLAGRLAQVENIPQQDSAERAFNKLTRTFATQMEALKRYRTGGEQKVTVQHVSVSEGGQAIVGNVTQAARETARDKAASSPRALPNAQQSPMPIVGERASSPVPLKRKSAEPVTIRVIPARCCRARAAAPRRAWACPACRRRCTAKSVVECMAGRRDRVLHAATRMR
jgi:hypothetical protein